MRAKLLLAGLLLGIAATFFLAAPAGSCEVCITGGNTDDLCIHVAGDGSEVCDERIRCSTAGTTPTEPAECRVYCLESGTCDYQTGGGIRRN